MLETMQYILRTVMAFVAGVWHRLPGLTQLLIVLMAADLLLGLIIAIRQRKLSARLSFNGITKKVVALLLVGLAAAIQPHVASVIEIDLIQAASAFYIVPEMISITRNAAILEVPVFTGFKPLMRYFSSIAGEEKPKQ